jgi:hypothetical protein
MRGFRTAGKIDQQVVSLLANAAQQRPKLDQSPIYGVHPINMGAVLIETIRGLLR